MSWKLTNEYQQEGGPNYYKADFQLTCTRCGRKIPNGSASCPNCNATKFTYYPYCAKCGVRIHQGSSKVTCSHCATINDMVQFEGALAS